MKVKSNGGLFIMAKMTINKTNGRLNGTNVADVLKIKGDAYYGRLIKKRDFKNTIRLYDTEWKEDNCKLYGNGKSCEINGRETFEKNQALIVDFNNGDDVRCGVCRNHIS